MSPLVSSWRCPVSCQFPAASSTGSREEVGEASYALEKVLMLVPAVSLLPCGRDKCAVGAAKTSPLRFHRQSQKIGPIR